MGEPVITPKIPHMIREMARSYIEVELGKILHLKSQKIPGFVKELCDDLTMYLKDKEETIIDKEDLITMRTDLLAISEIINLLLLSSPGKSSWWALPLIQQCYEICEIDFSRRHILIIHSPEIGDYIVYPNIVDALPYYIIQDKEYKPIDVFTIPSEAGFDISSIALIGHEIGHIYWQIHPEKIEETIKSHFREAKKYMDYNLFNIDEFKKKEDRVILHIEEYLCDHLGSNLLGPAFDLAFLKFFCSLPSQNISSETHPPGQKRIEMAFNRLKSVSLNAGKLKDEFDKIIESVSPLIDEPVSKLSNEDEVNLELALKIYNHSPLKTFQETWDIKKIWEKVKPELDSFRPPFEKVSEQLPEIISPVEAIVGTVIYFYGGGFYKSNEYFLKSICDESTRINTLRNTFIKHTRYSISLYNFTKAAHQNYEKCNFNSPEWEASLWKLRKRIAGGESNPVIVVPTIDPEYQYGGNSIDLRLGTSFLIHKPTRYTHISPQPNEEEENQLYEIYDRVEISVNEKFILHPHQFVLASSLEYISLPYDYYALVLGRSTWGRLGLNIATATAVQAGFRGCLTLELRNLGETPLPLTVGARIAQLSLIPVPLGSTPKGYFAGNRKYIGPVSAEIPKIKEERDWVLFQDIENKKKNG
jgi:deoxycytidine triphosphate deaminase